MVINGCFALLETHYQIVYCHIQDIRWEVLPLCSDACLFICLLWRINLCGIFNAKSIFIQTVLFQTIQLSISTQLNYQKYFYFKPFSLVKQFYVCVYVCIYVCMYLFMCVWMCVFMRVYVYMCMHACVNIYGYVCMYLCVHICTCLYACVCMCVCVCMYVCMYVFH